MNNVIYDQIERLKGELAAATARETALIAALNLASGQALESMAREVALREALDKFINAATSSNEHWWVRVAVEAARTALAQPAPPVVPKAVADGLAEALEAMTTEAEAVPSWKSRPSHHHKLIAEAREALAKYKEGGA